MDLIERLDFLRPDSKMTMRLLNGSFRNSDGAVARDRMQDVSLMTSDGAVTHPPTTNMAGRRICPANRMSHQPSPHASCERFR